MNAFSHRNWMGLFVQCAACSCPQQCGITGRCYVERCNSYNQAYGQPGGQIGFLGSLFSDFRRDYNLLREADSDGGECD